MLRWGPWLFCCSLFWLICLTTAYVISGLISHCNLCLLPFKSLQTKVLRPDLWSVCAWSCPALCDSVDCQAPLSTGHHVLFQGPLLTRGLNPPLSCLLHWRVDSSPLHHLGALWCRRASRGSLWSTLLQRCIIKPFVSAPSMSIFYSSHF